MALAAQASGYEYLAICDHTPNVRVVPGLSSDDLLRQADEIAEVNQALAPFRVLRGVECDIAQTARWTRRIDFSTSSNGPAQPACRPEARGLGADAHGDGGDASSGGSCLSHPKGRILNRRPENALDLEEVSRLREEANIAIEVNRLPDRLDLSATHVREAVEAGVDLVLNSDAHSEQGLARLDLAVATARKGGATVVGPW